MGINTTLESASTTAASNGLERAAFVKLTFGLYVGLVRLFWRLKMAYVDRFASHLNAGAPTTMVKSDSEEARAVCCFGVPLVLAVEKWRGLAQISYPIVSGITIDVIDLHRWPMAVNVKPDKSMRFVGNAINDDVDVSGLCSVTSNSASLVAVPRIQPMKNACFLAVPKFCL